MASIPFTQQQRILKEVYRHYIDFQDFASREGKYFISYGPITLSLIDLQFGLDKLSPRKREAVYLNVIRDMKQKDAAAIMGITTVSVGQYVEQAMIQLAEQYFAEMSEEEQQALAQAFGTSADRLEAGEEIDIVNDTNPLNDWRCDCGKYSRKRYQGQMCEVCNTECRYRKDESVE